MNSKRIVSVVGGLMAVGAVAVVFSSNRRDADYEPTAEVTVYKTPT